MGVTAEQKRYLGKSVLDAARERVAWVFDTFPRIYVSFSGGKDSTVMLHLVMAEAIRRNRRVAVLFIDWECQFTCTIDHVRAMYELYADHIEPYWVALPIRTWNGCSQFEPEWVAWDSAKHDLWVRQPDAMSITDENAFPFYTNNMTFEEFTPAFGQWYAQGQLCANFVGIRTGESLNRWRTIAGHGVKWDQNTDRKTYVQWGQETVWNVYPVYDWHVADIWAYNHQEQKPYNRLYDLMHQAGMTPHQMRIDEPFGDTQRIGLWLYQVIEPTMWAKMTLRVAGANTAALYAQEKGSVLGNGKIDLPAGHTWQSYAKFLLDTMPPKTADHYKDKISHYVHWYMVRGMPNGIPDAQEADLGGKDIPSWRRICKTILKNDYWCRALVFSPTKNDAYDRYKKIMAKRRSEWGIL